MSLPTASDIILYTDSLASVLKQGWAALGIDAPGETNTISSVADTSQTKVVGDGTTTNVGLSNPDWKNQALSGLRGLRSAARYDQFFSRNAQQLVSLLDTLVQSNLPSGWSFKTTATQAHVFDLLLQRLNANNATTPAAPGSAGTVAAITDTLGALPNVASGSAPRIVHTLVSTAGDQYESLPSPQATQTALTGSQNAYSYQVSGTVGAGIGKMRIYRGYVAGGVSIYFWDQDVSVTAGSAYPLVKILQPDSKLRSDITPPAYAACLMTPEFAAIFALAFASTSASSGGLGSGFGGSASTAPLVYAANGMLSPGNVALGVSNGLLGCGNVASSGIFRTSTITGVGTNTYVAGAIQTANNSVNNVQAFVGASGTLQARVTTVLNGTCTCTVTYSYTSAAGTGSASLALSAMSGTAVGSTGTGAIPAGRIITAITAVSVSGTATSGVVILEGLFPRTY